MGHREIDDVKNGQIYEWWRIQFGKMYVRMYKIVWGYGHDHWRDDSAQWMH